MAQIIIQYQLFKQMLSILLILTITIYTSQQVSIQDTKISTTRSPARTQICSYSNYTFGSTQRAHASALISTYNYLTNDQIQAMIYKHQFSSHPTQTYLLISPHCLGLAILLISIPGIICCCVRPEKYPLCKKCRKQDKQMYSKVELKWPAFMTIFIYILISVGSAGALAGGTDLIYYYNNIGCRMSAIVDDTLYGRISPSDDSVFYIGLTPLKAELTAFNGAKLTTFFSQSSSSLNNGQAVRTQQSAIQNQISTQYTSYTDPVYNNAFTQSDGVTYTPIPSQFKTMYYGPETDSTKILGNIYSQLSSLCTQINAALDPMIAKWVYLSAQTQATVSTYITNTISKISTHETQLSLTLAYYLEFFDNAQQFDSINLGMKLVYGLVLALALLGLISAVVLTFCTVVRIRFIIYFTCVGLVCIGIITFGMLIFLAGIMPNLTQSCSYIDTKLSTQAGTVQLFNNLQYNASAGLYAKCSKQYGTGNLITNLNAEYMQSFDAINLIAAYTLKFNTLIPNFNAANFQTPFDQSYTLLTQIKTAVKLDFTSTTALNFLKAVSIKTFSKNVATCTSLANINSDSWVPSRSAMSCQTGLPHQPPCLDLSSTTTCPQGCYQIYDQLTNPSGDSASYTTHLYARYGTNCNYADYIINLHQQWTLPKITNINNVKTNVDGIKTNVANYQSKVSTIQGSLNSFKSTLEQNFNNFFNPSTGSFNGVDCTVVGQSIAEARDALCVGFLTSVEYNMIMLCIISYGILLLSCFSVCAGVRHYLHLQKMQVKVGYKGVPVSVTSNRIIDKFDA